MKVGQEFANVPNHSLRVILERELMRASEWRINNSHRLNSVRSRIEIICEVCAAGFDWRERRNIRDVHMYFDAFKSLTRTQVVLFSKWNITGRGWDGCVVCLTDRWASYRDRSGSEMCRVWLLNKILYRNIDVKVSVGWSSTLWLVFSQRSNDVSSILVVYHHHRIANERASERAQEGKGGGIKRARTPFLFFLQRWRILRVRRVWKSTIYVSVRET